MHLKNITHVSILLVVLFGGFRVIAEVRNVIGIKDLETIVQRSTRNSTSLPGLPILVVLKVFADT
jgi:hypothetical protein